MRNRHAASIIELIVAMAIMAIAAVGLTEILWINGSFSTRIFNKVDNIASANNVLEMIGRDVRAAAACSSPLDATTLTLSVPHFLPNDDTNATEFPVGLDSVVYQATASTAPNTYVLTRTFRDYTGATNYSTTMLKGIIVGPIDPGTGLPHIFDYVQPDGTTMSGTSLVNTVTGIIVNLDLKSSNASISTTVSQSASMGIRRQFYMRNHASGF